MTFSLVLLIEQWCNQSKSNSRQNWRIIRWVGKENWYYLLFYYYYVLLRAWILCVQKIWCCGFSLCKLNMLLRLRNWIGNAILVKVLVCISIWYNNKGYHLFTWCWFHTVLTLSLTLERPMLCRWFTHSVAMVTC